jgi:hypothetical protein
VAVLLEKYFGECWRSDSRRSKPVWARLSRLLLRSPSVPQSSRAQEPSSDRPVSAAAFAAVCSWIGGLPQNPRVAEREAKFVALRALVCSRWFLGFVSKSYSSLNLDRLSHLIPPHKGFFFARISSQNLSTITIDYLRQEDLGGVSAPSLHRARVVPPYGAPSPHSRPLPQRTQLHVARPAWCPWLAHTARPY